jgi:xanthine dehydrogenase accessory factor/LAO/AO transport system kinase
MQEVDALEVRHAVSLVECFARWLGASRSLQSVTMSIEPGSGEAVEILEQARRWRDAGLGVGLATVVATWGSSPRPAGSLLAVNQESAFVGSVSGGCVEGAVVEAALGVIAEGRPRTLEFGVSNEQAWEVGLACGGQVRIYVERLE